MMSSDMQSRLTRSCSDAAVGYATAATEAYATATTRTLQYWADHIRSYLPEEKEEPRSWYRHPDGPQPKARRPAAAASPLAPMLAAGAGHGVPDPMSMLASWMSLATSPRAPTVWPMAMMFMAAGVPRNVAVPAAEANAAAADATRIATAAVRSAFASYRTESGYAATPVVTQRTEPRSPRRETPAATSAEMPFMPFAFWPWLAAGRA